MEERKMYLTHYSTAVNWLKNSFIMFDELPEYDEEAPADVYAEEDEEQEYPREIFQYFISDCNDIEAEYLTEHFPDLHLYYSSVFFKWFLLVDHWGTSWDNVETRTDLKEAADQLRNL